MNQKERYLIDIDKAIRIAKEYGKWIPVDNRLPKRIRGKNGEYLPSSGYVAVLSDLGNVFITKYNFDFKTWIGRSDHKITHWKPVRNKKFIRRKLIDFMWISTSKRLPKEDPYCKGTSKTCLVSTKKYGISIAYYNFKTEEWCDIIEMCDIPKGEVFHWMPMPEAPWK